MILPDVNVLIAAHRRQAPGHERYLAWLHGVVNGAEAYGMSELVLSSVVRIVTNPRAFTVPSTIEAAITFADQLREQPHCVPVSPGPRHWGIFTGLCRSAGAKGNIVPDAYLAALAIESGSEWITADRGFARFPGLRWRHPLD